VAFRADRRRNLLAVAPLLAGHAGMVGSVMSGSAFLGSQSSGVAPAAQLSIFLGPRQPYAPSLEGHEQVMEMLLDPRVDVAQASHALGDTARFGSTSIQRIWANRLIARTGMEVPAAGGPAAAEAAAARGRRGEARAVGACSERSPRPSPSARQTILFMRQVLLRGRCGLLRRLRS
jgi:hypothetical protein